MKLERAPIIQEKKSGGACLLKALLALSGKSYSAVSVSESGKDKRNTMPNATERERESQRGIMKSNVVSKEN